LFNQSSRRGASSARKPAFDMPQDKNPRRFASDFINCVYFDLLLMASYFKENNLFSTIALALIAVKILFYFFFKNRKDYFT